MSESTETSTDRTVAPKQLVALIRDCHIKGKRIQSIAGEMGERVKNAVENGYLHRGAFGLMRRLYKMDETKRADFMRSIGLYMQICHEEGLFGEPEHVGDLVDDAEREAESETADSTPNEHGSVSADSERGQEILSGIKPLDDDETDVRAPFMKRDGDAEVAVEDAPKPRRGRKKAALEGADAEGSYTSVN